MSKAAKITRPASKGYTPQQLGRMAAERAQAALKTPKPEPSGRRARPHRGLFKHAVGDPHGHRKTMT